MKFTLLIYTVIFLSILVPAKEKLKVFSGVRGINQQPFSGWKQDEKEPTGFDVDVIKAIAKELKIELTFIEIDQNRNWVDLRREILQDNSVDVVAYAYSITEERKKLISFSKPYFRTSLAALVLKDSKIKNSKDLISSSVFAPSHTTGFQWAQKNIKGKINQIPQDFSGSIEDLLRKKVVDAYLGDLENLKNIAKNFPEFKLLEEDLQVEEIGLGVAKDNVALLKRINAAITKLQNSGALSKLWSKYFK